MPRRKSSLFQSSATLAINFSLCSTLALSGCVATVRGAPEERFDRKRAIEDQSLTELVIQTTLDPKRIMRFAASGATIGQRNEVIYARLSEIDAMYYEYERSVSRELRESGFALSLAGLAVGSAGALVTEQASQILSAVSASLTGAQEAFQKTVLIDRTTEAFLSQMRAGRASVKSAILLKLTSSTETYPLQAAIADLEAYRQAGTLTGALAGVSADATAKERAAGADLRSIEALTVRATYGESDASRRLNEYVNAGENPSEIEERTKALRDVYESQPSELRADCPGDGLDFVLYASAALPGCRKLADNLLERLIAEGKIE